METIQDKDTRRYLARGAHRWVVTFQILAVVCFFCGMFIYLYTRSWASWAIVGIIGIVCIRIAVNAGKRETLAILGIKFETYEQLLKQEKLGVQKHREARR